MRDVLVFKGGDPLCDREGTEDREAKNENSETVEVVVGVRITVEDVVGERFPVNEIVDMAVDVRFPELEVDDVVVSLAVTLDGTGAVATTDFDATSV